MWVHDTYRVCLVGKLLLDCSHARREAAGCHVEATAVEVWQRLQIGVEAGQYVALECVRLQELHEVLAKEGGGLVRAWQRIIMELRSS